MVLLRQKLDKLRPVSRDGRTRPPMFVRWQGGIERPRRRRAGAIVQKQPAQAGHDGKRMEFCGQQFILLKSGISQPTQNRQVELRLGCFKDATPGRFDARPGDSI